MEKNTKQTYDYQAQLSYKPEVEAFFHEPTNSFSYVVTDSKTKKCAIIDSILDYDMPSGTLTYDSADAIAEYVKEKGLEVEWHLETHMHADHISAANYLKDKLGGKVAIGKHISDIQEMYGDVFGVSETELEEARSQFDVLWDDFETFHIGNLPAFTFYTPGHTPADIVYGIGDALFVGDSLFMPDFGSARCDFPKGDASSMYDSVQEILALPESMRMFMCHDYLPKDGRTDYKHESSVREEKETNLHLKEGTKKDEFVKMREIRDATLSLPKLMIPSLQINVRAGRVPKENGKLMLKFPVNSVFSEYPKN